ncbi:MAG: PEP-CTERM sorting domain-containing protein [Planctomycetes bacterium]|nr:PEP-CTERM sorting domain-containing protein [Planctomycetota bacterium]
MMRSVVTLLCVLSLATVANAQLFVGVDDVTVFTYDVDPGTGNATPLWDGVEVWGAAYDPASEMIFVNDGTELYSSTITGPPGFVADITYQGAASSMVSLAWAGGMLYGTKNITTEAVYEIDPKTGVSDIVLAYDSASYDFGGLAYNPIDGLFYGTSDDSTPARGLYSLDVFGGGAINLIAEYPGAETDIDGLAIGENVAYLVTDEPGVFYSYDLSQGAGGVYGSFQNPWTSSEVFCGAAWIPEPASLALLALGGLLAIRRR